LKNKKEVPIKDWALAYRIESNFRYIISCQESYGWKIDTDLMDRLLNQMLTEREEIVTRIYDLVPLRVIDQKEMAKPFKLNGERTAILERWYNNLDRRCFPIEAIAGPFSRVNFESLNLESPKQRVEALQNLGWVPTEYNYKTDKHNKPVYDDAGKKIKLSPKLTEDSVQGIEVGELMVKYTQLSHRYKLVKGLKERLREDGSIGSGGVTCGCNTGRMMHRGVANIPRVGEFYGEEIRSLFSHREGYTLIGADLKSLENRLMGHFTYNYDNGAYAKRLESEDSHDATVNVLARIGITITRNQAKTLNYALGYGAQVGKVAEILDSDIGTARKAYAAWWSDKAAMKTLKERIEKSLKGRGQYDGKRLKPDAYIKGIDGRRIYVRSPHSLINCLIQNAGSVVNKFITCSVYKQMQEQGLDAMFVCNYHDEINIECVKKDLTIGKVTGIIEEAVKRCNEFFKFRIPMEMDIKVGGSWKEIH
jgi:DNA polymerase I-like protein with 3'-5' exonuclease and polymerase domains